MIKKTLYLTAAVALALASCTSDTYLGDPGDVAEKLPVISFSGKTGAVTRAEKTGAEAAGVLNNNFVVYGFKTLADGTTRQTVYDHYNVNYVDGSALSTLSNTAGWEYVNQSANVLNTKLDGETQDIKYWDFAARQYDFIAFSLGEKKDGQQAVTGAPGDAGYPGTPEAGNVIVTPVKPDALTTGAYTITGTPADLTEVYIADRITTLQSDFNKPVQFAFKPLAAKVRIGLYETIPGYSVKDVKFYKAGDNYESTLETTPLLFAGSTSMPSGVGTVTLKFNEETNSANKDYNKVEVASYADNLGQDVALQGLITGTYVSRENIEGGKDATPGQVFLGRTSNAATTSEYQAVVPTGAGHSMTLKMDYTLLSTDKSQETIKVRGATAVIPSEFCNWQPNHAYTYLFKISDNTSGFTNPGDLTHVGLYPVTFDAIIAATEEGMQQTITLMAAPSITTYAKGERIHEEDGTKLNYYEKGDYNIYICLQPSTLTLNSSNTKMYVATTTGSAAIVEATVADVIKTGDQSGDPVNTYTKDEITVKTTGAPELIITTSPGGIPAIDAPYGTAIPGNFAVFSAATAGTYVFEYTSPEEYYTYDEYTALTGNESVTQQQYDDLKAANSPLLLKPNKHYKVIVVKEAPVAP